jgi:hypothetical protein
VIRIPREIHAALAGAPSPGGELASLAAHLLVPLLAVQRVFALYAAPLDQWLLPVRGTLLGLLGLGLMWRTLERRPKLRAPLLRLEALAHAVDDALGDHERRASCFTPTSHAAGRARLDALALRVTLALEEAAAAMEEGRSPRPGVGPLDLHQALVANEQGVVAPSTIHLPETVREALAVAALWSRRGAPARVAAGALLALLGTSARAMLTFAMLALALAMLGLDPLGSDLGVILLLGLLWLRPLDPSSWRRALWAIADPRLAAIEHCATAARYGGTPLEQEDLDAERILRRRVLDTAAMLSDLGPLGTVGPRRWAAWSSQHRGWLADGGLPFDRRTELRRPSGTPRARG